jgi:hypothetical protein
MARTASRFVSAAPTASIASERLLRAQGERRLPPAGVGIRHDHPSRSRHACRLQAHQPDGSCSEDEHLLRGRVANEGKDVQGVPERLDESAGDEVDALR